MENDELRELWKKGQSGAEEVKNQQRIYQLLEEAARKSSHSLKRKLLFEFCGMIVISALTIWMFFGPMHLPVFSIVMCVVSLLFVLPNSILFFLLIRRTHHIDYGKNMQTHLSEFIRFYRTAMRWYLWSGYVFNAVIILLMIVNPFEGMDSDRAVMFRIGFGIIMVLAALIYKPYIHWMFGKQVDAMEEQLNRLSTV